ADLHQRGARDRVGAAGGVGLPGPAVPRADERVEGRVGSDRSGTGAGRDWHTRPDLLPPAPAAPPSSARRPSRATHPPHGSTDPGCINAVMTDGSVRFIKYTVDPRTFKRLGNKADGMILSSGDWLTGAGRAGLEGRGTEVFSSRFTATESAGTGWGSEGRVRV